MWSNEVVISSASPIDYWEMLKSFMDEVGLPVYFDFFFFNI